MLIYFLGVIFYFAAIIANKETDNPKANSFTSYILDGEQDYSALAKLLYFSMTTLAKIGYGDYYPLSDAEKIYTVIILFISMI